MTTQNKAIAQYMAGLKRAQNAPGKRNYPKVHPLNMYGHDATILYIKEFCSLNNLFYTPPVFSSDPILQENEAMNTTPAMGRALAVLHQNLGHTPEVIAHCAPEIAAWLDSSGALQKAGLLKADIAPKIAKIKAVPALPVPKVKKVQQKVKNPTQAHDVWYYLLGKDKPAKRVQA